MSKISVVIPAFNCENYIGETLESVLRQTLKAFEIIVVNDGSTDGTAATLEKFRKFIRYIYQANKGPSAARNVGISYATGDYIAFLDNDDVWLPEKLSRQVDALRHHPEAALVFTEAEWVRDDGTTARYSFGRSASSAPKRSVGLRSQIARLQEHDAAILVGDWYGDLLDDNFIINSSVLVRRQALEVVGRIDESLVLNSDYDLWLRIASKYPMAYLNLPVVKYRLRESSMSGRFALREYSYRRWDGRLFEKHLRVGRQEYRAVINRRIAQCYELAAWGYFHYGELADARIVNREARSYSKLNIKLWMYFICLCMPDRAVNLIRDTANRTVAAPHKQPRT